MASADKRSRRRARDDRPDEMPGPSSIRGYEFHAVLAALLAGATGRMWETREISDASHPERRKIRASGVRDRLSLAVGYFPLGGTRRPLSGQSRWAARPRIANGDTDGAVAGFGERGGTTAGKLV